MSIRTAVIGRQTKIVLWHLIFMTELLGKASQGQDYHANPTTNDSPRLQQTQISYSSSLQTVSHHREKKAMVFLFQ